MTAHRTTDPHRIHHARHYLNDDQVAASRNAFESIARGEYRGTTSVAVADPTLATRRAEIAEALRAAAIIPAALTVACVHAKAGVPCWPMPVAVCGERISRVIATRLESW